VRIVKKGRGEKRKNPPVPPLIKGDLKEEGYVK